MIGVIKMTNAEKYKEVFGLEPDVFGCPTLLCSNCPIKDKKPNCVATPDNDNNRCEWWDSEYKESKDD